METYSPKSDLRLRVQGLKLNHWTTLNMSLIMDMRLIQDFRGQRLEACLRFQRTGKKINCDHIINQGVGPF